MKRLSFILSLVALAVLLTGCLAAKVNVRIQPNPIVLTAEELLENDFVISDIKLELRTSGFSVSYYIEAVQVEVRDENGDEVFAKTKTIKETTPIVPGKQLKEDVPDISLKDLFDFDPDTDLPIDVPVDDEAYQEALEEEFTKYYNDNWKGKKYELIVRITGDNPTEDKAEIQFK